MARQSFGPRTLVWFRTRGWIADKCEQRIPGTFITRDLFGIGDYVAVVPGEPGVTVVQVTSMTNHAARRRKIRALSAARTLLAAGNRILILSWAKRGYPLRWTAREEWIRLADLEA